MPSPGEDIQSWSTTAANNGTADPLIDWHEGQARASVNNSARSMMAAHAKDRNLVNGSIVTTGTKNAQQFLSGLTYTTIPTGLTVRLKIGAGLTNDDSATLNMDGLGAVLVKTADGTNLLGGELVAGDYADLLYNGTNWIFLYSREFFWERMTGGGGIVIGMQKFDTAGPFTYTPSPDMECCIIECFGPGGGGGGASGWTGRTHQGGGGGSGGYSRKLATAASIGLSQSGTIGAGGTGGAGTANGSNGGTTNLGTLCIANGGNGGLSSWESGAPQGGAGATAGTGDVTIPGTPGGSGFWGYTTDQIWAMPGDGGAGPTGGGGLSVFGNGTAGSGYGAGGAGATAHSVVAAYTGGTGSAGACIITEFAGRGAAGRDGNTGATGAMGPPGPAGPGTGDVLHSGTPAAGQMAQWVDTSHIKGVTANVAAAAIGMIPNCGRLIYVSATQLKFVPYNGDLVKINGTLLSIPAAGFSLANTGVPVDGVAGSLAANTTYLVVAYDQGGGGTLGLAFFSTLTHSASTTAGNVGVEIRTGVDTQSVVGLIRTNASGQFQDSAAVRGVLSWFNRQPKIAQGKFTADRSTASTTPVQINSEIDIGFLTWADGSARLGTAGTTWNSGVGQGITQIYLDAAALEGGVVFTSAAGTYAGSIGMTAAYGGLNAAAEGYHTATLYGAASAGTQTWGGASALTRCTLTAQTFG